MAPESERVFERALFPPTAKVLGVHLPRFTLWHLAALRAINSPFVLDDPSAEITIHALHLAVRVCEQPSGIEPNLKLRLRDRIKRLWYDCRTKAGERRFVEQAALFMAWMRSHGVTPEMWDGPSETESRPISAPPILYRVSQLVAIGIPYESAWAMSPGFAAWYLAAHDERTTPGVRFWTAEDERIATEMREQPDLTDAEQVETARRELPPHMFEQWLEARQANPEIETPKPPQNRLRSGRGPRR